MCLRRSQGSRCGASFGVKVAIVGAGIAGLAAARLLVRDGQEVQVFERNDQVGGRSATHVIGDYIFDHGATSVTPRGQAIEPVILDELPPDGLVEIKKPIYVQSMGRISSSNSPSSRLKRYCYRTGMQHLGQLLAEGIKVHLSTEVESLAREGEQYIVAGERFDALILTPPIPQTELLLGSMGVTRNFSNSHYRPVLSVMLGYDIPLDTPYHAIIEPEQTEPLTWLSVETMKSPGRAPEGHTALVAQLSPSYSRWNFDAQESEIIANTVVDVARLLGAPFREPKVTGLKRWRYSQPEMSVSFESVNRKGSKLLIASDGLIGGRIENAYDAGALAAQWLSETVC